MANSAYNQGANVLHIYFEDNTVDIRRKHYTIWTGIVSDEQPAHIADISEFMADMKVTRANSLKLVKLPAVGTTISDIRNKIRKLESEGFRPDMIIVDYIDCISGERSIDGEEWKGEGLIMRSLESMTDEFDVALWAATQGNRDSITSEVVTANQMGGSIKKAQIGHVVISAGKTLEQKENKLATVTLLKSRIGADGIVFSNCLFNNELLEINTDSQNTLLGHREEQAEQKKERAIEVYKQRKMKQLKLDKELTDFKHKLDSSDNEVVSETVNEVVNEETPNQRAARIYRESKQTEDITVQ